MPPPLRKQVSALLRRFPLAIDVASKGCCAQTSTLLRLCSGPRFRNLIRSTAGFLKQKALKANHESPLIFGIGKICQQIHFWIYLLTLFYIGSMYPSPKHAVNKAPTLTIIDFVDGICTVSDMVLCDSRILIHTSWDVVSNQPVIHAAMATAIHLCCLILFSNPDSEKPGTDVPSGGLTLIVGAQKWGFSCKIEATPCGRNS